MPTDTLYFKFIITHMVQLRNIQVYIWKSQQILEELYLINNLQTIE